MYDEHCRYKYSVLCRRIPDICTQIIPEYMYQAQAFLTKLSKSSSQLWMKYLVDKKEREKGHAGGKYKESGTREGEREE